MTLFPEQDLKQENMPLAYRLSPKTFDEYMGQEHILSAQKPLRKLIEQDQLRSLLLWGPPGTGKTALSRLIAKKTASGYLALNAVIAKTADIKMAIEQAKVNLTRQQKTILFIDELHRFNKIQQDALLPDVENGLITLIGATTENPFFSVIPALLSRSQVFELKPLSTKHLKIIFEHALQDFIIATYQPRFEAEAVEYLMLQAQGDARKMLNILETAVLSSKKKQEITREFVQTILQTKGVPYNENEHYDTISAFIKSLRGSDADAAVYWLAKMLKGGEDPQFIARRLIIFASEDIGNADPQALILATSLLDATKFIGLPEIRINLAQVTTYLATAPKSNASYLAINKAMALIDKGVLYEVPDHLKKSGQKKYLYPHDYELGLVKQEYLPESVSFYEPKQIGFEKIIKKRIEYVKKL